MSGSKRSQLRTGQVTALGTLLIAILIEVLFYPQVARWLYLLFSGRAGWDGSGLGYVRLTVIAPVGLALIFCSLFAALQVARRKASAVTPLIVSCWLLNGALLALSIAWYARLADKG